MICEEWSVVFKCLRLNSCRVLKTGKKTLFDCVINVIQRAHCQMLLSSKSWFLLEEFKTCPLGKITIYLNEQEMEWLSQAAVCADKFLLTHLVDVHSVHHEHTVTGVSVGRSFRINMALTQLPLIALIAFSIMKRDILWLVVLLCSVKTLELRNSRKPTCVFDLAGKKLFSCTRSCWNPSAQLW